MTIRLLDKNLFELSFKSHIFNAGEPHICLDNKTIQYLRQDKICIINAKIQNSSDILYLYCLVDAIRRSTIENIEIHLCCSYFPGSRQDRICNRGEPLTVKIYADLINNLNFSSVEICDPHSEVTPALLNNCLLYPVEYIIEKVIKDCQPDAIIIPDAGATKRVEKYISSLNLNIPLIQCLKKRDTNTGKLSGFEICSVPAFSQPIASKLLIIDDLCDAGGTFIGLAKEWKDLHKKNQLYLYVTHGIFSKGVDELLKNYDKIYTTDAFINNILPSEKFQVFQLYYNIGDLIK